MRYSVARLTIWCGFGRSVTPAWCARLFVIPQLLQQRLRLLEVGRVKALREPAIDRRQQITGFGLLALLLPQATQAHGGPQLQRFGLLPAGDVQGPLQPGFRLRLRRPRLPQEQDAPEAIDFRFPPAFLLLLHQGVGLGQRLEAVFRVAQVGRDLRQQGAKVWDDQRCPGGPQGGDPLADLGHPHLALALHGQRPPPHARSLGHPLGKALLGRERDGGLCVFVYGRHVPAKLIDVGRETSRKRQTKGMRQLMRQRQGIVEAGQGLRRVPQ